MRRILFVDDEPNILDGIRRMLRPQRDAWSMSFASSGREALELMGEEAFDVVVTDMKMPEMNGAELLSKVMHRHPRTVRIVLSGQSDTNAAMLSTTVAHQFIAKPCSSEILCQVVEQVCGLEDLLGNESLQEMLGSMSCVPVLPRAYEELTSAVREEDVDIQRVASIAEQDVAISAKILQLVNSSFFGLATEITDVRRATTYLGVNTVRELVLRFSVFKPFDMPSELKGFLSDREPSYSLLAARIARELLDDEQAAERAFLASILHDLGTRVLISNMPDALRIILDQPACDARSMHQLEIEALGVSHAEVGAYLLGLWGMPSEVVVAMAHHHDPRRAGDQRTFGVLGATHVAHALAREALGAEPQEVGLDEEYLRRVDALDRLPAWRALAAKQHVTA